MSKVTSKLRNKSNFKLKEQHVYFQSSEQMNQISDNTVNLTFTSPPYWLVKDYHHEKQIGRETYQNYLKRLNAVWDECFRVTKDNGLLIINVGTKRHLGRYYPLAMDIYKNIKDWKLLDRHVWVIPNALPQPNHYMNKLVDNKHEDILIFAKNYEYEYTFNKIHVPQKYRDIDPRKHKMNSKGKSLGNVFKIRAYRPPNIKQNGYHEAAFPEDLANMMIRTYTKKNDVVLDPFVGSGTVLKISRHLQRQGIGFEINESNKELIKKRIMEDWTPVKFKDMDVVNSS